MFMLAESNLQYVTSITFLLTTYAKYMSASKYTFNCRNVRPCLGRKFSVFSIKTFRKQGKRV